LDLKAASGIPLGMAQEVREGKDRRSKGGRGGVRGGAALLSISEGGLEQEGEERGPVGKRGGATLVNYEKYFLHIREGKAKKKRGGGVPKGGGAIKIQPSSCKRSETHGTKIKKSQYGPHGSFWGKGVSVPCRGVKTFPKLPETKKRPFRI